MTLKSSQFHSNILQILGIPDPILVPPVTHFLGLNDSIFAVYKIYTSNNWQLIIYVQIDEKLNLFNFL